MVKKIILFGIVLFFLVCGCSVSGLLKDPYKLEPSDYLKSYKPYRPSGRYHKHNRRYIRGDCKICHIYPYGRHGKKHHKNNKKIIIVPSNRDTTIIIKNDS